MALFAPDASEELLALFEQLSALAVHDLSLDFPVEASALVVDLGDEPRRRLRAIESSEALLPVLVIAAKEHAPLLTTAVGVSDFLILPASAEELYLRVRRLTHAAGNDEVHHFKDLELNLLTYQATLGTTPLDLTYMEYELLRFFVEHPHRVWSREQLLSKVWGYEYYGGARNVDVHVRRLRAKLGEHRASWITTVRSVGYRFG
ncbi:MAG: response regulator transcription factor [Actinomycetota bacterium]|nr:response regulator transcription factor [Actinomycetota bacterium]